MGLEIRTNILGIKNNNILEKNTKKLQKSVQKLASGYKINRASDDASGLSISEKMRILITSFDTCEANVEDGISVCNVADGALDEVDDMLLRCTELTMKASNGILGHDERQDLQYEIDEILDEIDRIGVTTNFNGIPLFKGREEAVLDDSGRPLNPSKIPFSDFKIADTFLHDGPFGGPKNANLINLAVGVKDVPNLTYNLIFGNGGTSNSSIRLTSEDGTKKEVFPFNNISAQNLQIDSDNSTYSREFNLTNDDFDVTVFQKIKINESDKKYELSYGIKNNNVTEKVNVEFMFHADTAYNNDDRCEGYFYDNGGIGTRMDKFAIYSDPTSPLISELNPGTNMNIKPPITSFSIIDVDNALPFTEKISFSSPASGGPDSVSIGHWSSVDDWEYYFPNDQARPHADTQLGQNAIDQDLGFSLYWNDQLEANNGNDYIEYKFDYGIEPTELDPNISGITVKTDEKIVMHHIGENTIRIESGIDSYDYIDITIGEMNTEVLGINNLNIMTQDDAMGSIDKIKESVSIISDIRGRIGAQQNRLEHTVNNISRTNENVTAAKSRIKDTDMAREYTEYMKSSILNQTAQAMLSQANSLPQNVISLIQQ